MKSEGIGGYILDALGRKLKKRQRIETLIEYGRKEIRIEL